MKFVKETTSKGLQIPTAAMKLSGFESSGKVELDVYKRQIPLSVNRLMISCTTSTARKTPARWRIMKMRPRRA